MKTIPNKISPENRVLIKRCVQERERLRRIAKEYDDQAKRLELEAQRHRRKARKLSNDALARELGVHRRTISYWIEK